MRSGVHAALALGAGLCALSCGGGQKSADRASTALASLPAPQDAPYELADDQDLEAMRELYDAMPLKAEARASERRRLGDEYARRIQRALEAGARDEAFDGLLALISLWAPSEIDAEGAPAGLAEYRPQVQAVRDTFARSGSDLEAVTALCALRELDPVRTERYDEEIDEIFAFADDLAVAQYGEGAQRSRPIEILESVVEAFPSRFVISRLSSLYVARQKALDSHFKRNGADFQIIRAHGQGVLKTVWNIVRIHALAGRVLDAAAFTGEVVGLGDNADLRRRLRAAAAEDADVFDWVRLSAEFRSREPESRHLGAAYGVCRAAIGRFPKAEASHLCAAKNADDLGSYRLAIRHYQDGLALDPDQQGASSRLAALYEFQVTRLALGDRPRAARRWLTRFEDFFRGASRRFEEPLETDLADVYATMGRGLVSLGELSQARRYLDRSMELRPTLTALEYLGTTALKQDRFEAAIGHYERALELDIAKIEETFDRNRILRLTGEAHQGAEKPAPARRYYQKAMLEWSELRRRARLSRSGLAEAEVERGRLYWRLGKRERALSSFERAIDLEPDGASIHADVVSFLIVRNEYERALDAYHRALGSPAIDDYYKVYMSLWVLAEARRRGEPVDPLARDLLAGRKGRLWYDDLARFASGRLELQPLEARATTRGRRAELLYYAAVLGERERDPAEVRALLERVLDTDMVLFFEYEMARHWLGQGFAREEPTAAR